MPSESTSSLPILAKSCSCCTFARLRSLPHFAVCDRPKQEPTHARVPRDQRICTTQVSARLGGEALALIWFLSARSSSTLEIRRYPRLFEGWDAMRSFMNQGYYQKDVMNFVSDGLDRTAMRSSLVGRDPQMRPDEEEGTDP